MSRKGFPIHVLTLMVFSLLLTGAADAQTLSDNQIIHSQHLGYDLQYRIQMPANDVTPQGIVYVTDGPGYIRKGGMPEIAGELMANGALHPLVIIYLDSRDPADLTINRRNQQFLCNPTFARFFASELVPTVESSLELNFEAKDRLIMGLSFGGLNAACFGLMIPQVFHHVGMHSPASDEHLEVVTELYRKAEPLPLDFYFSVGTRNDNTRAARRFHRELVRKGYVVSYQEVPFGHDWQNWQPLVDDLLLNFFAVEDGRETQ